MKKLFSDPMFRGMVFGEFISGMSVEMLVLRYGCSRKKIEDLVRDVSNHFKGRR